MTGWFRFQIDRKRLRYQAEGKTKDFKEFLWLSSCGIGVFLLNRLNMIHLDVCICNFTTGSQSSSRNNTFMRSWMSSRRIGLTMKLCTLQVDPLVRTIYFYTSGFDLITCNQPVILVHGWTKSPASIELILTNDLRTLIFSLQL